MIGHNPHFITHILYLCRTFLIWYTGFHTEGGPWNIPPPPQDFEIQNDVIIIIVYNGYRTMNKQINSINGYSCVQLPIKVQFYDFSVKKFQNVVKARDMLTHAF